MQIITRRKEMQDIASQIYRNHKSIGFVPTMGCLHAGHMSLIKAARDSNDVVVASIFVNPKQFGPEEDFLTYPRDFERDSELLKNSVDFLFCPTPDEMYFNDEKIDFKIHEITQSLCGLSRPHHFKGVSMVLSKLFHIVKPQRVYFGQKDYQQTVLVRYLLRDLFFEIDLIVCPTVRESDGLAMSSRNIYLSSIERAQASELYACLKYGVHLISSGERHLNLISQMMSDFLFSKGINHIDYVDVRDAFSLQKVEFLNKEPLVLALAVFLGKTRLIDNIIFHPCELKK